MFFVCFLIDCLPLWAVLGLFYIFMLDVFRLWLCTFTLSVSAGAVLLLPMSIVSNEVLHMYPRSYYVKWLNTSLIQGMSVLALASSLIVLK